MRADIGAISNSMLQVCGCDACSVRSSCRSRLKEGREEENKQSLLLVLAACNKYKKI